MYERLRKEKISQCSRRKEEKGTWNRDRKNKGILKIKKSTETAQFIFALFFRMERVR